MQVYKELIIEEEKERKKERKKQAEKPASLHL